MLTWMPSSSLLMHQKLSASMFLRASSWRLDTSKFSTSSSREEKREQREREWEKKAVQGKEIDGWKKTVKVKKKKWKETKKERKRKTQKTTQVDRHNRGSILSPPLRQGKKKVMVAEGGQIEWWGKSSGVMKDIWKGEKTHKLQHRSKDGVKQWRWKAGGTETDF